MTARSSLPILLAVASVLLSGCAAPTATLDLIGVARKGLQGVRADEEAQHAQTLKRMEAQAAALDAAFDADVRLVAAGQIRNPEGEPVSLTPEWVISARAGYAAARNLLQDQLLSLERTHQVRQDNLAATDESLEMASQLIVQNWNVAQRIKQHLLEVQRRWINE